MLSVPPAGTHARVLVRLTGDVLVEDLCDGSAHATVLLVVERAVDDEQDDEGRDDRHGRARVELHAFELPPKARTVQISLANGCVS